VSGLGTLTRDDLVELAPVLRRAVTLDAAGLARLRASEHQVSVLLRLPFGVLVARTLAVERGDEPFDATVQASDLLTWLDGDDSASAGNEGNAEKRPARLVDAEIGERDHRPAVMPPPQPEQPPARGQRRSKAPQVGSRRHDQPRTLRSCGIRCGPAEGEDLDLATRRQRRNRLYCARNRRGVSEEQDARLARRGFHPGCSQRASCTRYQPTRLPIVRSTGAGI